MIATLCGIKWHTRLFVNVKGMRPCCPSVFTYFPELRMGGDDTDGIRIAGKPDETR